MIEIGLTPVDLAQIRFARSPIQELVGSLHVLVEAERQAMHRRWLADIRPRVGCLRLALLPGLIATKNYVVDFLTPPPEHMDSEFSDEVARVRATRPEEVRRCLDELAEELPLRPAVRRLYDDPERHLGRLADELTAYWPVAVEPVWPRLRALVDADLGYRARELTAGGVARALSGLHPRISFHGHRLAIRTPNWSAHKHLSGTGLVLVPCVFAWPSVVVLVNRHDQPMVTYNPRGVGTLWNDEPPAAAQRLAELLGRSRAALLTHLDLPMSTTNLAAAFGLAVPTVSGHLAVLRRAGLVVARRDGRTVLYQRTPLASTLLEGEASEPSRPYEPSEPS